MLAMLAGCEPPALNPQRVIKEEGFEGAAPAGSPNGLYSQEQAHSWARSMKVGQEAEYGQLSTSTWGELGRPHHIRLRLWAWLPIAASNRATVEVVVRRPGVAGEAPASLGSHTLNLCEVVRLYQQWVPSTYFVSLPRDLRPTDEVVVFIWVRPGIDTPIYVDDFSIENLD